MISIPHHIDFEIRQRGLISAAFLELGIARFSDACSYVKQLPYRRNSHKNNVLVAIQESCGTCSTKHALLKTLADEHDAKGISLMLGIYRLRKGNAAAVGPILEKFGLDYLPEAHWFLRIDGKIHDYTFPDFEIPQLEEELLQETEVGSHQLGVGKDLIHRNFLENWLQEHPEIHLTVNELWELREKCIQALSNS